MRACARRRYDDGTDRVISEAFGMEVGYDGVKENIVVVKRSFPDAVTVDAAQIDAGKKACL